MIPVLFLYIYRKIGCTKVLPIFCIRQLMRDATVSFSSFSLNLNGMVKAKNIQMYLQKWNIW